MLRPGKGFYKRPSSVAEVVSILLALLIVPMALVLTARAGTESSTWKWVQTNGPYSARMTCLAINGTNLFAGAYGGGIFRSNNNGTSWTKVSNGLTNTYISILAVSGTNLFAGTDGGVFLSTDEGTNWTAVNNGLPKDQVLALAVSGTNLFAGTEGDGIFMLPDAIR